MDSGEDMETDLLRRYAIIKRIRENLTNDKIMYEKTRKIFDFSSPYHMTKSSYDHSQGLSHNGSSNTNGNAKDDPVPSTSTSRPRYAVSRAVITTGRKGIVFPSKSKKEDRPIKVGKKIHYWEHIIIGNGATAIVYEGFFEEPAVPAALKVIKKKYYKYYEKEIAVLRLMMTRDKTNHLVRYFTTEEDQDMYYIAMELGKCNIEEYIKENTANGKVKDAELVTYLHQACLGLQVMHCGKRNFPIVHRDIKPANMLLVAEDDKLTAKLTDFGISKMLHNFQSATTQMEGTCDWMSPNCLKLKEEYDESGPHKSPLVLRVSLTDDIFSLGMVIFFVITRGEHLFGSVTRRSANIMDGKHIMKSKTTYDNFICMNLVHAMINPTADLRPGIETVLKHPIFWTHKDPLDFITTVSNVLFTPNKPSQVIQLLSNLQGLMPYICNCRSAEGWMNHFDPPVVDLIQRRKNRYPNAKQCKGKSIQSLIEFIRDKYQHRDEWSDEVKAQNMFGTTASSYMKYFSNRFPLLIPILFIEVQNVVFGSRLVDEELKQLFNQQKYTFDLRPNDILKVVDCKNQIPLSRVVK